VIHTNRVVVMSKRDNQVIAYLTDTEKSRLNAFLEDSAKTQSELVRQAIVEYLDQDRAARVESQVRDLQQQMDDLADTLESGAAHTHKAEGGMKQGSEATERARQIVRRIQSNHDDVVNDDVVTRAIEDTAGVDERTIRKYKRLFRKRGILYEHPGEPPLWTTDSSKWLGWMEDYTRLNGRQKAKSIVEEYPASVYEGLDGETQLELQETEGLL
jgi:hypothetical protein